MRCARQLFTDRSTRPDDFKEPTTRDKLPTCRRPFQQIQPLNPPTNTSLDSNPLETSTNYHNINLLSDLSKSLVNSNIQVMKQPSSFVNDTTKRNYTSNRSNSKIPLTIRKQETSSQKKIYVFQQFCQSQFTPNKFGF